MIVLNNLPNVQGNQFIVLAKVPKYKKLKLEKS
jgi:hypothetical protein